ncbi:MAG: hypothetical protein M1831_000140 [Alyxoria varia]|nr:MAG: hypothetical protein M1831_000140 [Alyxoria varia]
MCENQKPEGDGTHGPALNAPPPTIESGPPAHPDSQSRPSQFPNLASEIVFILVCSAGQLFYSILLGNIEVIQLVLLRALGISECQAPWLIGSFLLANGVSVSLFGSLMDLVPPRRFMVGAFAWMTIWNVIGAFSISSSRYVLFFVVRAMQGFALGILVSGSISILGRLYRPGVRKTRVFSLMSSFSPIGFSIGGIQAGALANHLGWVFGSTAIISGICCIAAYFTIPSLRPAKVEGTTKQPSIRDFDFLGATLTVLGNVLFLFGITQGSSQQWAPYTYSVAILGLLFLLAFYFVERFAHRPLIPHQLWRTPGFTPLIISFFLSYGSWLGAWQPFAVQFFLFIQNASPLRVGLYFIPNAIAGVIVMWLVAITLNRYSNHWIFSISMLANAIAPALFLPQTPNTSYWALSMPGIAVGTFGPDMAFAAATIFITSSVPKSYQGAAGSLLITVQNLSAATMVAVAGAIGTSVDGGNTNSTAAGSGEVGVGLKGLRAIWWFALGVSVFAGVITAAMVRIRKEVEGEHVSEDS